MALTNKDSTVMGMLPPRGELSIPIFPVLQEAMEPVVFSRPGYIIVTRPALDRVVLRSTVDQMAGYVLVFAPSSVVRLTRVPWAELARQGTAYLRAMMMDVGQSQPQRPK
jgi:hypothetical protein